MNHILGITLLALVAISCGRNARPDGTSHAGRQDRSDRVNALFSEGLMLSLDGDRMRHADPDGALDRYRRSAAAFRDLLAINPDHSPAMMTFAHTLYMARRYQESIEWYDRALARQPGFPAGYHERGMASLALGRPAEAGSSIRTALRLDTSAAFCAVVIGDLRALGDWLHRKSAATPDAAGRESLRRMATVARALAYDCDRSDRELGGLVAGGLRELGDSAGAEMIESWEGERGNATGASEGR